MKIKYDYNFTSSIKYRNALKFDIKFIIIT